MNRLTRGLIFYLFLIIFLISAPILILYTAGYRLNPRSGRLERLGALIIKSNPSKANLKINQKIRLEKTPAALKLSPDEYLVELALDGHLPWQKRLPVRSQETTFAEDIVLWSENNPQRIEEINPELARFSRDGRFAVWLETQTAPFRVGVYDFLEFRKKGIIELSTALLPPLSLNLSPDQGAALIRGKGKTPLFFLNLEEPTNFKIQTDLPADWTIDEWGETRHTLYGLSDGFLVALNLITGEENKITRLSSPDFLFQGLEIWSLKNEGGQSILYQNLAGNLSREPTPILVLPPGDYHFLKTEEPFLALQEKNQEQILIIDRRQPEKTLAKMPGLNLEWRENRDGQKEVLAWTDFELWRVNLTQGNQELIRRQAAPIQSARWYPGEHIFYSSDQAIYALELDNRGERARTTLVEIKDGQIFDFFITKNGERLYYLVGQGQDQGIYQRPL